MPLIAADLVSVFWSLVQMEDLGQQPDFQPSIQSFLSFLDRSSSFEVIDPESLDRPILTSFIVPDKVQEYLEWNDRERLKQIIADLFPRGDGIYMDDILPDYIAVFCTLLKISKGWWIKHFRHHVSLSDARLPFDPKSHPPNWPNNTGDPDFLKRFCDEQWKYCVPVFRQPFVDKHFPEQTILPIVYKKSLSSGGSATLWLIRLHPAYNKLLSDAEKVRLRNSADTFVLKTYITAAAATTYAREVEAFRRLQQQGGETGIIGFHGSFTKGDEHHVLLEYADKGTLEEYLKKETPPVDPEEIINFWEALFKILYALSRIHLTNTDGAGGPHIGWHQDVKPENILVVSNRSTNPSEWQFKLADLGTSHFKRVDASRQDSTASDSYGTRTYGAPECYRPDETSVRDKLRVGQNVDIWSLGCVYSEAARWVKSHYKGVVDYRNERKDEISKIAEFQDADCFHDGSKVLIAVKESHLKSTTNLRTEDYITRAVVDRMITNMLDVAPARPTAANLWYISKGIVSDARNQLQLATFSSGEGRATGSRSGLSRSRTVPEHTPPSPPVLPPGVSPPDSPDFERSNQRGRWIPNRPKMLSTHSRISQSHLLESLSLNGREEQQGHSPDSIAEDSEWTARSPGSGVQQRSADIPRTAGRGNASPRDPTKRSSQHSVSTAPQAGMSDMGTSWESGSMTTMNGGYQRGARKRYSDNSESYSPTPILGPAGANRRSSSPDEIDHRAPKSHSRYNSQGESSHSRVVSDNSDFSTMTSTGAHHSNTENFTTHPHSQHQPPPTSTQHTEHNSTPPVTPPHERWSVEEALAWKRKKKGKFGKYTAIPNPQLHDRLRKRDHVFLIDDSASMEPHWEWLIKVVEALTYILKEVDPNGLDLSFTVCSEKLTTKRTTSLVELVESRSKLLKGSTDMKLRLSGILDTYQTELEKPKTFFRNSVLPMNLYVLTDGIWEPNCDAAGPITNLVNKLNKLHKGRVQVGIQFISFGNNAEAIHRLNVLDSGLGLKPDIVDHEPSTGNVWKMLLGSTNDYYDSQDERPQYTPTTSEKAAQR